MSSPAVATPQPATPAPAAVQVSQWTPSASMTVTRSANFSDNVAKAGALITSAINGKTNEDRTSGAEAVAALVQESGVLAFARETGLVDSIVKGLNASGKKDDGIRLGAVGVFAAVSKACGRAAELVLFPAYQSLLNLCGDKKKRVRDEAVVAAKEYLLTVDKNFSAHLLPLLFNSKTHLVGANTNRLELMKIWVKEIAPKETGRCLNDSIPAITRDVHDASKDVAKISQDVLTWLLATSTNPDLVPLLAACADGLKDQKKIPDTVYSLASTTFIQDVDMPTFAILSPILTGGLSQASSAVIKRASCRIIENMSKLVEEPRDLAAFVPVLLPLMEKARDTVADPEVREVCGKACKMFIKKSNVEKSKTNLIDEAFTMNILKSICADVLSGLNEVDNAIVDSVFQHVSQLLVMINQTENFEATEWEKSVKPYFALFLNDADASTLTTTVLEAAQKLRVKEVRVEEITDAEELCKCDFSLAYGNKVLLKKTNLHLHRGFKYGLMGPNDCGKTSLMRAIANQQIDGLPPASELRTVFVETDIQGELSHLSVVEYMFADALLKDCGISKQEMSETLQKVGFCEGSPANITSCVGELSGGWRMKLALARCMLLNADILLLDEPTNHLDTYNVKWLQDYLMGSAATVIMVTHDTKLLDVVCDHIIHIEDFKLENFKGNLTDFVKVYPEAQCYFDLISTKFSFKFPAPGKIPGINSKGKALMKMNNITFTYPGVAKPQLTGVSVQVCLASRTGIVGINGAGKSTMIRLLMGELEPDEGSGDITKHPNCRVGYIAQHAFHHIENHLDKTCNEYIRWRYQTGDDREALVKVTAVMTEEELAQQKAKIEIPYWCKQDDCEKKIKAVIEEVYHTRQSTKKKGQVEHEFEARLAGSQTRTWITRKVLEKNGWAKLLKQIDERIALRETLFARPLTLANVTKHMNDVGLADEFSTHMKIGALSTGQKVKVVLGAALWNQPHILILDEPTNYLDRDSLGALAGAIREFDGGVIMISHNSQFVDTLCPQIWHLENGTLNVKGDADWMRDAAKIKISDKDEQPEGEMVDKFGNTVVLKKAKKDKAGMSNKEKRALARKKKNDKKNGIKNDDSDDEDWEE